MPNESGEREATQFSSVFHKEEDWEASKGNWDKCVPEAADVPLVGRDHQPVHTIKEESKVIKKESR